MQFTVSSGALTSRLQTLQRVISNKNTISILECFLFEVADGMLTITASDSENVMQMTVELDECSGDGRFAIPNLRCSMPLRSWLSSPFVSLLTRAHIQWRLTIRTVRSILLP